MRIYVESVNVIDYQNKKSRKLNFDKGINVITSRETSRGKSSILRSIYHSLGANAAYDSIFKSHNKIFETVFYSEDNTKYRIIRFKNKYIIYKDSKLVLQVSDDYTKVARFFELEFGNAVYLTDKKDNFDIAPTTYLFIPYFLDQDQSWKNDIVPFKNINQFTDDQLINLYYYHLGALDVDFYKINRDYRNSNDAVKKAKDKVEKYLGDLKKLRKEYNVEAVSFDETSAKSTLDIMKKELDESLSDSSLAQKEVFKIENAVAEIESQIKVIDNLLNEYKKEVEKNNKKRQDQLIKCKSCGESISISDFDDFDLRYNTEFLNEKRKMLIYQKESLITENKVFIETYKSKVQNVKQIANKYNETAGLFDKYIRANATKILMVDVQKELTTAYKELGETEFANDKLRQSLQTYVQKKKEVNRDFVNSYYDNLLKLEVVGVDKSDIRNFKKYILSGSQYVRSTLAFFTSFIKLKEKHNPDRFNFPIIIDSPFEGDQDGNNRTVIIDTISNLKTNEQVFIGMRDAREYFAEESNINIIELNNEKGSVLLTEEYDDNKSHIEAIISIVVNL